ncbi:MAG: copper chaperone PCu(A)C [Pseudolabrys sp.]|nr:copper chaperone PCu(A)C [Pseudolabrys sp.]MBV9953819.1 copper chaperone PCu(A)C [Pseudolabrys sp.]
MHAKSLFAAAASLLLFSAADAADIQQGDIKISAPWTRATPKGATVGGGYMTITNVGSQPDRLVSATSDIARSVEIHEMAVANGVMTMRPLDKGLDIKPGATVELKPGGLHVMFVGLGKALEKGSRVKARLTFEKAGTVDVEFDVAPIGASSAGASHGH